MPPPAPEPIVGIDLGTTNSLVAVAGWGSDGKASGDLSPRIIPDERGRAMLPSVVRFDARGGVAAMGYEARESAVAFPLETISSVKRLMGRGMADVERTGDQRYLSYRVVPGEHNTARIKIGERDKARIISPQEVSAIILRRLKEQATRALGVEVKKAVVTVPAYFDDAQRQATRDAGRLAGLEVVRIVNEPTAAALAYGLGTRSGASQPQVIVVYDLGGGTFDVSILRLTPAASLQPAAPSSVGQASSLPALPSSPTPSAADFFQVLATSGDTHLGGDDMDNALVKLFAAEINALHAPKDHGGNPIPLEFSPETRQALRDFAEQAKIRLSTEEQINVRIDLGKVGRLSEPAVYTRTITRPEFETLISPFIDRTITACRRALSDAERAMASGGIAGKPETPACIVMVGGATRIPLVRKRIGEFFGLTPYTALDPDQVVALGAAVQGSVLSGASRSSLLLDVVPLSLGIETVGGAIAKLIMRNSTVPARASERFSTSVDNQTAIKLNVLQGEREMAADCRSLGEFTLRGLPAMPAGIPRLRVDFLVDANGVLSVSAVEERSGKRAELQVVPNHGLSREEVERMERESLAHAREDMARHRIVDLIANAKLDVRWIERQTARMEASPTTAALLGDAYISDLKAQISQLKSLIAAAESDWRSVDPNRFQQAKESLDRASVRMHEVSIAESLKEEQRRVSGS